MNLRTKLSASICLLVTLPMILGGTCAYLIARHYAMEQVKRDSESVCRTIKTLCDGFAETGEAGAPPVLRSVIHSMKIGQTGYPFVLRSDGTLAVHPTMEGKSLKGAKDARGKPFVDEMLSRKDGWIEYWWKNPGETTARKKFVRYVHFQPWDWVIAVGSYEGEFLQASASIRNWTILGTAVALLMALGLAYLFSRSIGTPVAALSAAFERLASADLTARVDIEREDELGTLAASYRSMQTSLVDLLRRVSDASGAVAAKALQISGSSNTVASGAEAQSAKASEVAAAIEEVSSTVLEVSRNAQEVAQSAATMSDVATKGEGILSESLERIGIITEMVGGLADLIDGLGKKSESIGAIIRVIDDIADQTNLLALNAAIEAARAGDHGRGFAVVADEVRKLAEKTTQATKEVEGTIQAIQTDTQQAVSATASGKQKAEEAKDVFHRAGESFRAILHHVSQVSQMVGQIAVATEQQSTAVEEMSGNIENIALVSRDVADSTGSLASAAQSLAGESNSLQQAVGGFKLS